jgi:hypothetical protein
VRMRQALRRRTRVPPHATNCRNVPVFALSQFSLVDTAN